MISERVRAGVEEYRNLNRQIYLIVLARFINSLGNGTVYPFVTLYFYNRIGLAFTLVGTGLLANQIANAGGAAAGGYLADRFSRKEVMVASMGLSAGTLSAYAFVTTVPAFFFVAILSGFSIGLYAPASQAMVADLTVSENREQAYGLLQVAGNAGFGSGVVFGGVLYGIASHGIFLINGATSGFAALFLLRYLPQLHGSFDRSPLKGVISQWRSDVLSLRILTLGLLNVGFAVAYAQMQSTVPVFASNTLGLSSSELGTIYVLNPFLIVTLQLPFVSWVRRWRRTRGLLFSTGFWMASFMVILFAYVTSPIVGVVLLGVFVVLRTAGEILHSPLIVSLTSDMASSETRGSQLSIIRVASRLGWGIGPVIGGMFFDYGYQFLLWPGLIGMCLLIAVGLLLLEPHITPLENGVSE